MNVVIPASWRLRQEDSEPRALTITPWNLSEVGELRVQGHSLAWVTHAYNPSYSSGRDQEDCSSTTSVGNYLVRPYLEKKPITKKGWWSGSRCRP
jgi:hypothetical protein